MAEYRFEDIAINSTEKKKPVESDKEHYLGLEHLDSGTFKVSRFGSEVAPIGDKLIMKKGDVLFGKRRAYQKKVAIAPFDGIFSAHGMVLRPKEDVIDKNFFPLFIASDYFLDAAIKISVGSLSPTINWRDLKELKFNLPELDEQKKLAEILWQIVATMESYKKLLTKTDEMIKAKFVEMFGTIDNSLFGTTKWKNVLQVKNGKDTKDRYDNGIYPIYGSGGIMGRTNEYLCPENSIIIGRKGTIDKPILIKEKYWNVDTAFGLIPNDKINYIYLYSFCLQFDFIRISKSAVLPSLTKTDLENIDIPIPPIELQNQFADFFNKSEESKASIQASLDSLSAVYKKIIAENLGGSN